MLRDFFGWLFLTESYVWRKLMREAIARGDVANDA